MFQKTGDIDVYYEEAGEGEPLLLLHGNGGSVRSFRFVFSALAERFRVIALDTRWHGKTKRGEGKVDYDRFASDLDGFVRALGLQKPNIIGYSDGAITALIYAARYPENVGKVLALGANLTAEDVTEDFRRYCVRTMRALFLFRFIPPLNRLYRLHRLMLSGPYPGTEFLSGIGTEVLVMAGENDITPLRHTEEIAAGIPCARLVIVPDAGHSVMKDQTEVFLRETVGFLSGK